MSPRRIFSLALTLALVLCAALPPLPVQAATITVNSADDTDDGACNALHCSLREAILAANILSGADTIVFAIPGSGVHSIQPTTPLPTLTDDAGLLIDGYSQPGSAFASVSSPAVITIELDGSLLPVSTLSVGIGITSSHNGVRGLAINRFPSHGIAITELSGADVASFNYIVGNYIGTDPSGTLDRGNGLDGVYIGNGASSNWVGGDLPGDRNVLSGNGWDGVSLWGEYTELNHIEGNYIGTNAAGDAAISNHYDGVYIYGKSHDNVVGRGNTGGAGNLLSGNERNGVRVYGAGSDNNLVAGNWIGINAAGTDAIPNGVYGVDVSSGPHNTLIGGLESARHNVISGNPSGGVHIYEIGTTQTRVVGNIIGADPTGYFAIPNSGAGIWLSQTTTGNVIGDCADSGYVNLISGNNGYGIGIVGGSVAENVIACNIIGLRVDIQVALPNTDDGIRIGLAALNNWIGPKNLISGNGGDGVDVLTSTSDYNTITGNLITRNAGLGINLNGVGNDNAPAPVIYDAVYSPATVSGAACPFCIVEVFGSSVPDGEGEVYLGKVTAGPAGDWDLSLTELRVNLPYLTATATDAGSNTSQFSALFFGPFEFGYLPAVLR